MAAQVRIRLATTEDAEVLCEAMRAFLAELDGSSSGLDEESEVALATDLLAGDQHLVLMAETESQLTASVGILGAVAGYLFRSMHQDAEADSKADSKARRKTLSGTPESPDDADNDRN